ncbi:MAG: OmcA/MtrC family decaheme c-type cytochrome [Anaeromyxobacter sp.]
MPRPTTLATTLATLAAAALACSKPGVGAKVEKVVPDTTVKTYAVALTGATVDAASKKAVVDFTLTYGGQAVALADLATLRPTFTLAELTVDPESGLASWKSALLTGSQTAVSNPIGGPGTHAENVLANKKQPGSEATGTAEALGTGGFRYTFANALPDGYDGTHTWRVGVWLNGVSAGTHETCTTLDFVPAGGTAAPRDLVADADCQRCHDRVLAHGRRVGVKLCTTCHTWQAVDPDTVDPAAPLAATTATNPNPVDFGRLVHRIHRGRNLPTLYNASSAAAAPALGSAAIAAPFVPGRNTAVAGRKYTIVGFNSSAFTFGQIGEWSTPDGATVVKKAIAAGVVFPRDYRDCDACHQKAPQGAQAYTAVSRRTCAGCHPDVWFATATPPDAAHLAHPGGVQADDTACAGCHLAPGAPKLYVDTKEVHTPVADHERFSPITASIVSVAGLLPGGFPTVVFTLSDRTGPLSPINDATTAPPVDSAAKPSPVARKVTRLAFVLSGPTSPDRLTSNVPLSESVTEKLVADDQGRFTYTFKTQKLPDAATGAWTVMLEARRQLAAPSKFYDLATDTLVWPYTGEGLTEYANNAMVDVAVDLGDTSKPALARRTVVDVLKCNACHKTLLLHGGNRSGVDSCPMCHTPDQTDWAQRPKLASGNVLLAGTLDGLEERSVHFKTMIHRIHTGGRKGIAQLDAEPFVIYGFGKNPLFFDEGVFPNDLANCRVCHLGESFRLEAIPVEAAATVANETASLVHKNTAAHGSDAKVKPMQAACTSCHDTGTAHDHANRNTVNGVEACVSCHGESAQYSVYGLHGLEKP